jgi:hypothetical protein
LKVDFKLRVLILAVSILLTGCFNKYIAPDQRVLNYFDVSQNDLLLVVKVKNSKGTGFYPIDDECEQDENCIIWSNWYVYDAEVLDVLNGQYKSKLIKFALLSHADYIKEIKNEWYVQLNLFENKETSNKLGTLYYIENHSSKFSISH